MAIFKDFFHKVFGAVDPEKLQNLGKPDPEPEEPHKESTFTIKSLMNNKDFLEYLDLLYKAYEVSSKDLEKWLRILNNIVSEIIEELIPNDFKQDFEGDLESELAGLIIHILKTYRHDSKIKNTDLKTISQMVMSSQLSGLHRMLNAIDSIMLSYQTDQEGTKALIEETLGLDFNDFISDVVPVLLKYRSFQTMAYQDITPQMKKDFLDQVNKFYDTYISNFTYENLKDLNKLAKETGRQNFHLSIIGGRF